MSTKIVSNLSDYKLNYLKEFEQKNKHLTIPIERLFKVVESTLSQLKEPISWADFKCYYDGSHWQENELPYDEKRKDNSKSQPNTNKQTETIRILKLLEILRNFIIIEENEDADKVIDKLKCLNIDPTVNTIIDNFHQLQYTKTIDLIADYIASQNQITEWVDPECIVLKNELQSLEDQLGELQNEKYDLEKLISEFENRYSIELGDTILSILKLKRKLAKDNPEKFKNAQKEEEEFHKQLNTEKKKKIIELNKQDKVEIKKTFRKACLLCHPDKVEEEFKAEAAEIFNSLKDAYDVNDLKEVNLIFQKLKSNKAYHSKYQKVAEKDLLKAAVSDIRSKIDLIVKEIDNTKSNEIFKVIMDIDDWKDYFEKKKEALLNEKNRLESKFITN